MRGLIESLSSLMFWVFLILLVWSALIKCTGG
jgi:hypothetical protein